MEDFPLWLKLVVWGVVGVTVIYTAYGVITSLLQS